MLNLLGEQEILQLLYIGVALGVFVLVSSLSFLLNPRESGKEARSRRMKLVEKGKSTEEILAILKPAHDTTVSGLPFIGTLPDRLRKAAWGIRPGSFLILSGLIGMGAAALGSVAMGPVAAMPAALVFGIILPFAIVDRAAKKRGAALTKQLPDALDLLSRGLRVGHPLNTSVKAVADEMADPVGTEFGIIFDQVSYGDDLSDAFTEFAERVDLEDVHYLATSIGIQHGTGGDLARVIDVLARVVRSRIALRRKVRAISAEGRMTAMFLSSLPLIMLGFTSLVSPDYYGGVSEHPWFIPMAVTVLVLTGANAAILAKLVNFKV
ncbi:MAG: type II secretion system F family protein [Pseudooceanicola sp.]